MMKKRQLTNRIIFHHSLSTKATIDMVRSWHIARGWDDIGYHYGIYRDGSINHGRDIKLIGAHCMGRNYDSIGIYLEGDFSKTKPSYEQIKGCMKIYHELCRAYSKKLKIEFHRPLFMWNACPGKLLDRKSFIEDIGKFGMLNFG